MAISAEETIKGIIAEAKKGNVTDHQSDGSLESWKIPFSGSTYRVVVTDKKAKTGKTQCPGRPPCSLSTRSMR